MKKIYLLLISALLLAGNVYSQCNGAGVSFGSLTQPACNATSSNSAGIANTGDVTLATEAGGNYTINIVSGPANYITAHNTNSSGTVLNWCSSCTSLSFTATSATSSIVLNNSGCPGTWTSGAAGSSVLTYRKNNPTAPTISYGGNSCGTHTLSISGGAYNNIEWYSSTDGVTWGSSISTASSITVNSTSKRYYHIIAYYGSCSATSSTFDINSINSGGNFPPVYYGNAVVSSNTTMGGVYQIYGDFTVNSGVTVTTSSGCILEVDATNITVNGTINGNALGNSGGAGGAGGSAENPGSGIGGGGGSAGGNGSGSGAGVAGTGGSSGTGNSSNCGTLCIGGSDGCTGGGGGAGGGGGGAYGGAGGNGSYGAAGNGMSQTGCTLGCIFGSNCSSSGGTYGLGGSAGTTYGTSTGTDLSLGSGGAGAGGGGGGWGSGSSGSNGGSGGGAVKLISSNTLTVSGTISVNGGSGSTGGNAGGNSTSNSYGCTASGTSPCTICTYYRYGAMGGGGAGAGGGSGGGIMLQANGNMTLSGTLAANGGTGGNAGSPTTLGCNDWSAGGAGGGGGRIKLFTNPCATNSIGGSIQYNGGTGGTGSNSSTGNSGSQGTYTNNTISTYTALTGGSITSAQTVNFQVTPSNLTQVTAPTGGTTSYTYDWFTSGPTCATTPTNGSSSAPGWTQVSGANSTGYTFSSGLCYTTCFIRRVTSGTCYSWSNVITITVNPFTTTANSASAITCSSFTANWSSTSNAAGYLLDVSTTSTFNTGTFVLQDYNVGSPLFYNVTGLTSGQTYYYRVRPYNLVPCNVNGSYSGTITVPLLSDPIATAGSNISRCDNSPLSAITMTGATATGSYSGTPTWSGGSGSGTWTQNANPALATFTPTTTSGSFTATLTLTNTTGCSAANATSTRTITWGQTPSVSAANVTSCTGTTAIAMSGATASGTYSATPTWSGGSGSGTWSQNANPALATFTPSVSSGSFTATLSVTGSGACTGTNPSTSVTITWGTQPVATAGTDITTCTGTTAITMTGATASGTYSGTPTWSVGSGSGTWSQNANPALASFTPSTSSGSFTATLTLTGTNGCSNSTSTRTITWGTQLSATPGSSITRCDNSPLSVITMTGSSASGTISSAVWSGGVGLGTWNDNGTATDPSDDYFTPSVTSGSFTATLTLSGSAGCAGSTTTVTRTISWGQTPTANAGPAIIRCDNNPTAPIIMTGATAGGTYGSVQWIGGIGLGVWTQDAVPANAYLTPNVSQAAVNVTLKVFGTGACTGTNATSVRNLSWGQTPVVNAGPDIATCSGNNPIDVTASSGSGSYGNISWTYVASSGTGSVTSGGATLYPEFTPTSTNGGGSLTVTVTGIYGCTGVNPSDDLLISWGTAVAVNAGSNQTSCATTTTVSITGATATNYSSVNWTTSGTGTFVNGNTLTPDYQPSNADVSAGSVTLTITANAASPCTGSSTSGKTLTFQPVPVVNAGANQVSCSNVLSVSITGATASNYTTLSWATSGTGTFTNGTTLTPTYNPSVADLSVGSVTLTLTANAISPCTSNSTSNKTISFQNTPTANSSGNQQVCSSIGVVSLNGTSTNTSSTIWTTSGTGTFADATAPVTTYTPSIADLASGTVTLTLTGVPVSPCSGNAVSNAIITFQNIPTANAGISQTLCSNNATVSLTGATASNYSGVSWSTSGTGTFTNGNTLTPTYNPSGADISAGSVTLSLTATAISPCASDAISSVTISFSQAPTANAGTNILGCDVTPVQLSGTATNYIGVHWTTSGSGTFSNANILNPNYTPSTADLSNGSAVLTLTATGTGVCSSASHSVTLTLNVCSYVWLGTVSTDWHTPANWNTNSVPNSCSVDVLIPQQVNNPVIYAPISVRSITISNNVVLTLMDNISVCGNVTMGGVNATVQGNAFMRMTGSGNQTMSGTGSIENLAIVNSSGIGNNVVNVLAGSSLSVAKELRLEQGVMQNNGGGVVTLLSNITTTAYVNDFCGTCTGTYNGNITAQRYVMNGVSNDQHFISSPVNAPSFSDIGVPLFGSNNVFVTPTPTCDENQLASGSNYGNVFEWVERGPNGNGTFTYNCLLSGWEVKSAGAMENAKGYSVYLQNGTTVDLTGTPNTGDVTTSLLSNTGYAIGNVGSFVVEPGWHIAGNPYPSSVWLNQSHVGIDPSIQLWNTGGTYTGTYQPATMGNNLANAHLAPFQAFMFRVLTPGTTSFTFHQNERETQQNSFFHTFNGSTLQLDVNGNGFADVTYVNFDVNSSSGYDLGVDASKIKSNYGQPTLFTLANFGDEQRMSINSFSDVNTTPTVPVGLFPGADGNFSFKATGLNSFDPTQLILLEDTKTGGAWHNFRDNDTYAFSSVTTDTIVRFVLHFTPPAEFSSTSATCLGDGIINIVQPGIANWNYAIANSQGVVVSSGVLNSSTPVNATMLSTGVYTVTLVDAAGYTVVKNISVGGVNTINAGFTMNTSTADVNQQVSFHNTTPNSVNYNWEFSDGTIITGVANPTYAFLEPGVYTVTLTVQNSDGCISTVTQTITVNAASGLVNLTEGNISVYGFRNNVMVDFSKMKNVDATITIYNLIGQELSDEHFGRSTIYSKSFENLEAAYVLVKVRQGEGVITRKVFIANSK